jgi:hypothetical protein
VDREDLRFAHGDVAVNLSVLRAQDGEAPAIVTNRPRAMDRQGATESRGTGLLALSQCGVDGDNEAQSWIWGRGNVSTR